MKQNETHLVPESSDTFVCECCDYTTSRSSQYERHLLTTKHINSTKFNSLVQISSIENKCNNAEKVKHFNEFKWQRNS